MASDKEIINKMAKFNSDIIVTLYEKFASIESKLENSSRNLDSKTAEIDATLFSIRNDLMGSLDRLLNVLQHDYDNKKKLYEKMTAEDVFNIIGNIRPEERWKVITDIKKS